MSFQDAVRTCLQKYAVFSGRARRSEFWWFVVFYAIVSTLASIVDAILGLRYTSNASTYSYTIGYNTNGLIQSLASLALLLPRLGVAVRRLHDTDRSGWWLLLTLIPVIGSIILIVWWAQDGHADNRYGPSPKALAGGYPPAPGTPPY